MSVIQWTSKSIWLSFVASLLIGSHMAHAATNRFPGDVDLPPVEQRQIIGTWADKFGSTFCTKGIEKVKEKFYIVLRCQDRSGGDTGAELVKVSKTKFKPKAFSPNGDYYVIHATGELGIYDNQGSIATLPKHSSLWP